MVWTGFFVGVETIPRDGRKKDPGLIIIPMESSLLLMALSALLYAINVPLGKILLGSVPPLVMASLTYLGGAIGVGALFLAARLLHKDKGEPLKGRDWLYVALIGTTDTISNALLYYGLTLVNGETASLLQSFEVVATALVAFLVFRERISWRLLVSMAFLIAGSAFLSFNPEEAFAFSPGSLIILACASCWGVSNNLLKRLSKRDPFEVTTVKCAIPGLALLILSLAMGQRAEPSPEIGYGALLGFAAYGLSMILSLLALRHLSAPLGTAIFAANPLLGAVLSLIVFQDMPIWSFYVAASFVVIGEGFATWDSFAASHGKI